MAEAQRRAREARARMGWEPPGPLPPGALGDPELEPASDETLDAFAGHWRLFQLRGGHRYSTDDLLAAWWALVTMERAGCVPRTALDLGTGIGSVGLWLLWLWSELRLTALEVQPRSLALARRSARWNGVAARGRWLGRDLRDGVHDLGVFDLVTGSPPYWDPGAGTLAEGPQKGPCRFELHGGVEAYLEAMAGALAPSGHGALVFDGRQAERVWDGCRRAGLAVTAWRPVISREGDAPLLMVVAVARGTPPEGVPPAEEELVLRHRDGTRSPEFRALRSRMGLPPGPV